MGTGPRVKTRPFRSQFMAYLSLTLVLSMVCTGAVWGISLTLLTREQGILQPANFYERQIPDIVEFTREQGADLISPSFQPELEQVIPLEGISYQVSDRAGNLQYGSISEPLLSGPVDVARKLNTWETVDGRIVSYHPIVDSVGDVVGVLTLSYRLTLLSANRTQTGLAAVFIGANMLAPFLFILLFTIVFARRIGKRLEPPIQGMIDAAHRIRQKDLDFALPETAGSTELTQLAEAFENMRSALQSSLNARWRVEEQRRDMVAAIIHDLQTSLTIIAGHVDNLLEGKEKQAERLDKYLRTIRRNTDRAARLLSDMSALAEVDQLDFGLEVSPVDMKNFFHLRFQEYAALCDDAEIHFTGDVEMADDSNGWMHVDAHRLDQMLINIVENSLRFTPKGGQIHVGAKITPGHVQILVQDTGPGFPESDLTRIFDPFYQGDRSRSIHGGRMGLGLYVVKTLAEKHGGTVAAVNRPEGGASVTVEVKG